MSDQKLNRRDFFKRAAVLGAVAAGAGTFLSACEKPQNGEQAPADQQEQEQAAGGEAGDLNCEDTAGLDEAQIKTRESLNYTDESPEADQTCDNCQLYKEPEEAGTCGGCTTVPGPIHPKGWCTAWVAAS
ncbi:MAG: high-potential iron-sulfur protein [Persicimonas sp.]